MKRAVLLACLTLMAPRAMSPALQSYLATRTPANAGGSFRIHPCETGDVEVEIHVRPKPGAAVTNDNYVIGVAPFAAPAHIIAAGPIGWTSGANQPKTITVKLDGKQLTCLLCSQKSEWLDVFVEDDTVVELVRVTR